MKRRLLFAALTLLLFGACSKTATIQRANKPPIEAVIERSDESYLFVELPLVGGSEPIARAEVIDIDHPGNVHLLVGSIFTGISVMMGALGIYALLDDDPFLEVVGVQFSFNAVVYGAIGVPLGVWGYKTWSRSKRNAASSTRAKGVVRWRWRPEVSVDDGEASIGVGVGGAF